MSQHYFTLREVCPICASVHTKELYSKSFEDPPVSKYLEDFYSTQGGVEFEYLKGASYILDECQTCSLIYQRSIPNDLLMVKLYEKWIDARKVYELEVKNRSVEYFERIANEIRAVVRHFERRPGQLAFLDFGMGWGEWCYMAKAYGASAYGAELSQTRINYAKSLGIPVIEWKEIPEYRFDFINTEQVFEHLANPLETFEYLCNSLKPNGIIKVSVPNGSDIKRRLAIMDWTAPKGARESLNPVAPLEHINCFTYNSLVHMARIANLAPVQIHGRPPINRRILDFTLREIIRPYYLKLTTIISDKKSTYLYFQQI